jgi:hypothetical protein
MKSSHLLSLGLLALVVAAYVLFRSCQDVEQLYPDTQVDSLKLVLAVEREAMQRREDSTLAAHAAQDSIIGDLALQLAASKVQARNSAKTASYWADKYDSAKAILDTAGQLAACDSLVHAHDDYVTAAEVTFKMADSVISAQRKQIDDQRAFITLQSKTLNDERARVDLMLAAYVELAKENAKLKRKQKMSWWKAVVGFAAGVGVSKL